MRGFGVGVRGLIARKRKEKTMKEPKEWTEIEEGMKALMVEAARRMAYDNEMNAKADDDNVIPDDNIDDLFIDSMQDDLNHLIGSVVPSDYIEEFRGNV
jgi:hypothetical protein